jgi:prevent-host-death family protein
MKFMEPNSFSFRSAQMPKTVSTREAQDSLSTLIGWAKEHRDQVIVESHGEPAAVLMSFAEYETLRDLREQLRREEVWSKLRQLRDQVSARNADLDQAEIDQLAEETTRDAIDTLVEQGKIRFAP